MSAEAGTYWGATRSVRGLAVAVVDALHGYTAEHAPDPAFHRSRYDAAEHAILAELDCADVPSSYALAVQAIVESAP